NTVRLWKERFVGEGLGGLYGRHRGRSRSKESVRLEARVLRLAQRKPADGSTHWSTRKIAAEVGTNHVRVTRILAKAGLQPHRLRRYWSGLDCCRPPNSKRSSSAWLQPRSRSEFGLDFPTFFSPAAKSRYVQTPL